MNTVAPAVSDVLCGVMLLVALLAWCGDAMVRDYYRVCKEPGPAASPSRCAGGKS